MAILVICQAHGTQFGLAHHNRKGTVVRLRPGIRRMSVETPSVFDRHSKLARNIQLLTKRGELGTLTQIAKVLNVSVPANDPVEMRRRILEKIDELVTTKTTEAEQAAALDNLKKDLQGLVEF